MRIVIVHSHFRRGGVRRVIELATPHLVRAAKPGWGEVMLVGGEAPDADWLSCFRKQLGRVPVTCAVEPALGYFSEQRAPPSAVARRIRAHLASCLAAAASNPCLVWAHNQGLGRNLLLTRELERACAARDVPLVFHHHDWWFDNRWTRWPEMRRAGFRTLADVAQAIFPCEPNVRHVALNQADAVILEQYFPQQSGWLPNLAAAPRTPAPAGLRRARGWLHDQLGDDAPVWLLPCRLLRRKNIAEALLLARWLRPGAWLVTTGGVSSVSEQDYADRLAAAAHRHGWRLRLGILRGDESTLPSVPDLLAASEAVLLTSIQEGFGLPYLEAAAARRPLIARGLPNVAPDLAQFGFRFPQYYEEVLVDPGLFDWTAEQARQRRHFRAWRAGLPRAGRDLAGPPPWLAARRPPGPVPFSRLTLTAQLDVLRQPSETSWNLCAPLNPFLHLWRRQAAEGALLATRWPRAAARWLSGRAYARRFGDILQAIPAGEPPPSASHRCQQALMQTKLQPAFLYPLLYHSHT